ncbi:MAG: Eco57I restriction-modification methylase domain-containing protein [Chloroflexota bacterium]|nr:Eco57I restriction-modification methylase domain-containing protein [Chloroflexota bacterium]MDQ5864460.1 Eco57I restriction-modification methylase domain-containing protein [Chloroflexota bacterium]
MDVDPHAVEVAKLSLLLVVLEGATDEGLAMQLRFAHERALPDLDKNIKCGNSLIGPDYPMLRFLPDDERSRVNLMAWADEFAEVMSAGGFDVVGNPPCIRIQGMKEWAAYEVDMYKQAFQSAGKGNYDKYALFVELGLRVLNSYGRLGYILPHKFFNAYYGEPLRKLISEGKHLYEVVHFGDQQVFTGATTYTALLFLHKRPTAQVRFSKVGDLSTWEATGRAQYAHSGVVPADQLSGAEWNFTVGGSSALFERLSSMPTKLGQVASIFVGLQTSADTVFLFKDSVKAEGPLTRVHSKALGRDVELESPLLKPVIRSGSIGRYWATPTALVLFPYKAAPSQGNGKARMQLIPEAELRHEYPKTWAYLEANRELLTEREHGRFALTGWYQLYPKNLDLWEQPKLMVPYMVRRLSAFYDESDNYFVNVTTGGFGITVDPGFGTLDYTAALLNSKVLDWYMRQVSTSFHGGYFAANKQYLVQLPLPRLDLNNVHDRETHAQVVALAREIAASYKRLEAERPPDAKTLRQRDIAAADRRLEHLVCDLYGLSDQERQLVEHQVGGAESVAHL